MNMKSKFVIPGLVGIAAFTGVTTASLISTIGASAETSTSSATSTASTSTPQMPPPDFSQGGHVGKNGVKEEELTGDTATKAIAAAKAKVSDATVIRAETDAEGATYEVHMKKSDGSIVTVYLDAEFKVTSTEDGPNPPSQSRTTDQTQ